MSHGFLFSAFERGDAVSVALERLCHAFSAVGIVLPPLSEGVNDLLDGLEDVGDVSVCVQDGEVVEVAIDRPRYTASFRLLSFHLITTAGLVMYSDNGSCVFSASADPANLPEELLAAADEVNLSVRVPGDLA